METIDSRAWIPSETSLRAIEVHELLPQQEPFVMIDRLVGFDATTTVTETDVRPDRFFIENGHWTAAGLVENIAQTCAARIGYVNKYILKRGIEIGYIGAVSGLRILETPAVGTMLTTRVVVMEQVLGMTLAKAQITCQERLIAETQMKIAVHQREDKP